MNAHSSNNAFWQKVKKTEDCWLWTGALHRQGYGFTTISGKKMYAHRAAWMLTYGSIPEKTCVCHRCDVTTCVRPSHLFLGTQQQNMQDASQKGRLCNKPRGSQNNMAKMTEAQAYRAKFGTEHMVILAREFSVTYQAIQAIRTGKTWRHILEIPNE